MRKRLSVAAIVVLCLALVVGIACGGGEEEEEGVKEVKFGCGLCISACPTEALRLEPREQRSIPPWDRQSLNAALMASLKMDSPSS